MPVVANTADRRDYRALRWPNQARTKSTGKRIHVAAVCYRVVENEPEFLLVRTRSGRWTFPKGGVDGDATNAEAAAREAYEEAGVKGTIERDPFHWYFHSKRDRIRASRQLCRCMPISVRSSVWWRPRKTIAIQPGSTPTKPGGDCAKTVRLSLPAR